MALTLEQDYIVHKTTGHAVVLAGSGSGKTHTIIEKISYIFEKNIIPDPYGLLAITFTNAAANEIRSRLRAKGFQKLSRVWIGTFHAFGSYLLSCYGSDIDIQENFELLEKEAQDKIINHVIAKCLKGIQPSNFKSTLEALKRKGIYPGRNDENLDPKLRLAYEAYQKELAQRNALDFGDLVALAVRLLQESVLASRLFKNFFRYVVADEFQDSDLQQLEMIYLLAKDAVGSTIVADDDQSIYRFRGAVRENVTRIEKLLNAEKIILGTNFRSDQIIVDAAKAIIGFEINRAPKEIQAASKNTGSIYKSEFTTQNAEAVQIAQWITKLVTQNKIETLGEIAVITRNRTRANEILAELDKVEIRWFDRSRLNFQDSWEISLGLAILSLSCDLSSSIQLRKVLDAIEDEGISSRLGDKDALDLAIRIRNCLLEKLDFHPSPENVETICEIVQLETLIQDVCWSSTDANRLLGNLVVHFSKG
jgi:DNA helicase-2/ATP-dependent DNA helicase PcrA